MASYVVKFSIEIPVSGKDIADQIDAYYAARGKFNDFNIDEFDKEIKQVDEETVSEMQAVIDRLHEGQH